MAVPYTQRSFYFLQTVATGQGAAQWVSDIPEQTEHSFRLVLPAWFPRKSLLCHVWAGYGLMAAGTDPVDVWMLVDPKGKNYNSAGGAEEWETITGCTVLMQCYIGGGGQIQQFADHRIDPPVLFDRDAGDKLWFGLGGNDGLGWGYFNLGFMVPNSVAPKPLPLEV